MVKRNLFTYSTKDCYLMHVKCFIYLTGIRYPLGRVIGGTVYPGLTLTAGTLWWCGFEIVARHLALFLFLGVKSVNFVFLSYKTIRKVDGSESCFSSPFWDSNFSWQDTEFFEYSCLWKLCVCLRCQYSLLMLHGQPTCSQRFSFWLDLFMFSNIFFYNLSLVYLLYLIEFYVNWDLSIFSNCPFYVGS